MTFLELFDVCVLSTYGHTFYGKPCGEEPINGSPGQGLLKIEPKSRCEGEKLGFQTPEGVVKEADLLPTSTLHIYALELARGSQEDMCRDERARPTSWRQSEVEYV